jgi:hypothetical protein
MCDNIFDAFDWARVGSILAKYGFSVIIIGCEFRKNSPQVLFEHDQMISALAPVRYSLASTREGQWSVSWSTRLAANMA